MKPVYISVTFAEHVSPDSVAGIVSSIAAFGNVLNGSPPGRGYTVEVFRQSKAPNLRSELNKWEQYGFLQWAQI